MVEDFGPCLWLVLHFLYQGVFGKGFLSVDKEMG